MEQVIISGAAASGVITTSPATYAIIKSVEIDLPQTHIGANDPNVTLSGATTGANTFYGDTTLDTMYDFDEDIYITTSNFSGEYSAIIRYTNGGVSATIPGPGAIGNTNNVTPWRFR